MSSATKNVLIQWGGFYTSRSEEGTYTVFQLLDFTPSMYHAAIYEGEFQELSSIDISTLHVSILHVPISSLQFYREDMILLGHRPLKREELVGLAFYLDYLDSSEEEIKEYCDVILHNAQLGPLAVNLSIVDEELQVSVVDSE